MIDIVANTSQLKTELEGARKDIATFKGSVDAVAAGAATMGKNLLRGAAAAFTLREVVGVMRAIWEETAEAERAALRLEAVLRVTGNTSGLTSRQIRTLADDLERVTLFDDKEIQKAAAMLATFGNVHDDVFRRAIAVSLDLATVFEKDVNAVVLALGQALDRPKEGMEALSRLRIKFTNEQKDTIAKLVEENNLLGAQAELLKALEQRVGGVAGAEASGLSGAWKHLGDMIDDAKKKVGGFFFDTEQGLERLRQITAGLPLIGPVLSGFFQAEAERQRANEKPDWDPGLRPSPVRDLEVTGQGPSELSKEVGGLTTLVSLGRANRTDIARLRELGRAHAEALRLPNLELETRVRLGRELVSIQESLKSLQRERLGTGHNLGAILDQTRVGATVAQELTQARAAMQGGLSLAMTGVGGDRGAAPFRDKVKDEADIWRETWINAVRGTQQAFADFFDRVGAEGFEFLDVIKGIAASIRRALAEAVSQQIVGSILGGLFRTGVAGAAGAGAGDVAQLRAAPVSERGLAALGGGASMTPVVVHQNIRFNTGFVDGASGEAWLRSRSGVIAGVVAQAASDAPAFARHLVAAGMR